jgi:hypothetical protein
MLHLLYALALLLLLCGACAILAERFTLSPALLPLPVLSGASLDAVTLTPTDRSTG